MCASTCIWYGLLSANVINKSNDTSGEKRVFLYGLLFRSLVHWPDFRLTLYSTRSIRSRLDFRALPGFRFRADFVASIEGLVRSPLAPCLEVLVTAVCIGFYPWRHTSWGLHSFVGWYSPNSTRPIMSWHAMYPLNFGMGKSRVVSWHDDVKCLAMSFQHVCQDTCRLKVIEVRLEVCRRKKNNYWWFACWDTIPKWNDMKSLCDGPSGFWETGRFASKAPAASQFED